MIDSDNLPNALNKVTSSPRVNFNFLNIYNKIKLRDIEIRWIWGRENFQSSSYTIDLNFPPKPASFT
jgi:hypothetical protein